MSHQVQAWAEYSKFSAGDKHRAPVVGERGVSCETGIYIGVIR